jgi:TatD DNase family protein
VFEQQLGVAEEAALAVVVHSRGAERETLDVLAGFDGGVVLHCFSSPEILDIALERGYYVSFAGNVTYRNASALRVAATTVPADRILAETDSPYLSPQPRRGRPNEPANVVHTLSTLAQARREAVEDLERAIEANAAAVFRLRP